MSRPDAQDDLREAIIAVSLELGAQLGEDGLTMRGLAGRLGVSPTALYQHFESKTAILQEIRLRAMLELVDATFAGFEGDFKTAIKDVSLRYVAFAKANPWLYRVLFEGVDSPSSVLDPVQQRMLQEEEVRLTQRIASRIKPVLGDLEPRRLRELLGAWWCMLHGVCACVLGSRFWSESELMRVEDPDAFIASYIDLVAHALLRSPT